MSTSEQPSKNTSVTTLKKVKKPSVLSGDSLNKKSLRRSHHHKPRSKEVLPPVTGDEMADANDSKIEQNHPDIESHENVQKPSPEFEPVSDIEILSVMPPSGKKQTARRSYPPNYNMYDDDDDDGDGEYGDEEDEEGELLDISSDDSEDIWIADLGGDVDTLQHQKSEYSTLLQEQAQLRREQEKLLEDQVLILRNLAHYKIQLVKMKGSAKVAKAKRNLFEFREKSGLQVPYHSRKFNGRHTRRSK